MATVKLSSEAVARAVAEADWSRIDAITDADIAEQVADDPDAPPLPTDAELDAARGALARRVRAASGLSQAAFAARYGIPLGTLRDWEQNRAAPDMAARTLLRVIEREPEAVARALASA